ncbi:MAG: cobalamin-dependent protein, partial [Acetobacterium sp.]|nr:cobalamin-dependent protein [Acetobacterium sp.]
MRVLFVSHPNKYEEKPDFPPIGLAYIGAIAKRDGHEVLLIDGGLFSVEKILRQTKEFSPEFIGVTCWTINRAIVWRLINLLSESMPDAFLCVGGQHPTYYPEHIFIKTNANAVVIGEGEDTISELLKALENSSDLSEVRGILFKRNDGALVRTALRPPVEQLDSIPFPY